MSTLSFNSVKVSGDTTTLQDTVNFYKNYQNTLDLVGSNTDNGTVNVIASLDPKEDGVVNIISSQDENKGQVNIYSKTINMEGELTLGGVSINSHIKRYLYKFSVSLTASVPFNTTFPVDPIIEKKVDSIVVTAVTPGSLTFNGTTYYFEAGTESISIPTTVVETFDITSTVDCTCDFYVYI